MHGIDHGNGTTTAHAHGFVSGLLCGAAVGAAIGLLMAPRSGAETRKAISDTAGRLRDQARRGYHSASERVTQMVDQSRRAAEVSRRKVGEAIDEARAAYHAETARHDIDAV